MVPSDKEGNLDDGVLRCILEKIVRKATHAWSGKEIKIFKENTINRHGTHHAPAKFRTEIAVKTHGTLLAGRLSNVDTLATDSASQHGIDQE
jgi:hypothetical protein